MIRTVINGLKPAYKCVGLSSNKPDIELDFQNNIYRSKSSGTSMVVQPSDVMTIGSGGYAHNDQGVLVRIPNDLPRIDHDPYTKEKLGVLLEGELTPITNNMNTTGTTVTGGTYVNGSSLFIDNTTIIPTFTESVGGTNHYIRTSLTRRVANVVSTLSIYIRPRGRNLFRLIAGGDAGTWIGNTGIVDLDLNTLQIISSTPEVVSSSITRSYGGWYRVSVSMMASSPISRNGGLFVYSMIVAGSNSYAGDGVSGFDCVGFQMETGEKATSFFPYSVGGGIRFKDTILLKNPDTVMLSPVKTIVLSSNAVGSNTIFTAINSGSLGGNLTIVYNSLGESSVIGQVSNQPASGSQPILPAQRLNIPYKQFVNNKFVSTTITEFSPSGTLLYCGNETISRNGLREFAAQTVRLGHDVIPLNGHIKYLSITNGRISDMDRLKLMKRLG